jgi:pilus assembly protein CpaB
VGRRLTLLLSAVVVAAAGTAMVFLYVKGANERALRDTNPQEVLVATDTVNAGTAVREAAQKGAFVRRTLPRVAIVEGAVSSINPIQGKVALTTIFPGQQILQQMFGDNAAAAPPFRMPQGRSLAVAFSFADPNRVAGYVRPGSWVRVFATNESDTTGLLLREAMVVAVGPPATSANPASRSASRGSATQNQSGEALVTLALNDLEARQMITAASKGSLYLGLLTERQETAGTGGVGATLSN